MVMRPRKDVPAIPSYDVVYIKITDDQKSSLKEIIGPNIFADDLVRFYARLEEELRFFQPWYTQKPPSLAERKAGIEKLAELTDELARAIHGTGVGRFPFEGLAWKEPDYDLGEDDREQSIIAADWLEMDGWYSERGGIGLHNLERELDRLIEACHVAKARATKEEEIEPNQEQFGPLARSVAKIIYDFTGRIPVASFRKEEPFIRLLMFCADLLRRPESKTAKYMPVTQNQMRPHAQKAVTVLEEYLASQAKTPD